VAAVAEGEHRGVEEAKEDQSNGLGVDTVGDGDAVEAVMHESPKDSEIASSSTGLKRLVKQKRVRMVVRKSTRTSIRRKIKAPRTNGEVASADAEGADEDENEEAGKPYWTCDINLDTRFNECDAPVRRPLDTDAKPYYCHGHGVQPHQWKYPALGLDFFDESFYKR
jgi:hypothetical protein